MTMTTGVIEAAIHGLQAKKQHIDAQIAELRAMLNNSSSTPARDRGGKGHFSPETIEKMRKAQ